MVLIRILVTEETFAYAGDRYFGQQVGAIQLRGQTKDNVLNNILSEQSQGLQLNVTKY